MPPHVALVLGPESVHVSFVVRWFGLIRVRGAFTGISGTIGPGDVPGELDVSIEVAASSVRTGIGLRDRHLRGSRFLDAGRHPVISFSGTGVPAGDGHARVSGRLRLLGRERDVAASSPVAAAPGASRVPVAVEFSVPRLEHGIGAASGVARANPLLWAIGAMVSVRVVILVPAVLLRTEPALAPGH